MLCLLTQSCMALCDLMDCSPPGPFVHGILQARILEWVAVPSSRGSSWPRDRIQVSHRQILYCLSYLLLSHSVESDSLRPHGLYPARLLSLWDSLGKNTEMGCHALVQGIFPSQGSNPGLLHCRQILYSLNHLRTFVKILWTNIFTLLLTKDLYILKIFLVFYLLSFLCSRISIQDITSLSTLVLLKVTCQPLGS